MVHVNKGTSSNPNIRCRLVCQEFNDGSCKDELFVGTPPLYIMRLLISMFASSGLHDNQNVMTMDVKSAFLYGDVKRDIFIGLPIQDPRSHSGNLIGKLNKAMYGTRDAPQIWQEVLESKMNEIGFSSSNLHPSV